MNQTSKSNKVSSILWLKQPVENVIIRINVKTRESVTSLPTLEEYGNKTGEENLDKVAENNKIEYTFRWQEKVFSLLEIQKYSDEHNCISDTELNYYNNIKNLNYEQRKIFTYVHSDCHSAPLPFDVKKLDVIFPNLNACFEKLTLENKKFGSEEESNSMRHLFKSEEYIDENEQWRVMHFMLDCSKYNEDSKPTSIKEHILLTLNHNLIHNYLVVTPDVNDIDTKPYQVDGVIGFEYGVRIEMNGESGEDMKILLKCLLNKWEMKYKELLTFSLPLLGRRRFYVSFEIVSAMEFDMVNIYIYYHIKIPDNIKHTGVIKGSTQCSKFITNDEKKFWRYGHCVDFEIECATGIDPGPLKIYLEAISVDWWGRHRTEGYSYRPLALQPGHYNDHLSCLRPEEIDPVVAEARRFFVGGCHLIKDLTVLDNPQSKNPSFRYTSTGTISIRWNIISQTPPNSLLPTNQHPSSSALKGAEAVLRRYKKAKATLAMATGQAINGSGDA